MTAIVQPIVTGGGGGGGGGDAVAQNSRGAVSGLAPAATTTLVSVLWGTKKLRGFRVTGDTDGEAWIEVDATPLEGLKGRINRVSDAYVIQPNPEALSSTATVTLRVQNTSSQSGSFEGTLYAE